MAWECLEHYRCECGHDSAPSQDEYKSRIIKSVHGDKSAVTTESKPKEETQMTQMMQRHSIATPVKFNWRDVVTDYTFRNLTVASDRLPAIGSIAELMKPDAKQDYAAGLWKQDFAAHLLWYVPGNENFKAQVSLRHETYNAPSWSWVSVTGPIRYFVPLSRPELDHYTISAEVLQVQVEASGPSPFGKAKGGHAIVYGLVVPVFVDWYSYEVDPGHPFGQRIRVAADGEEDWNFGGMQIAGDVCLDVKGGDRLDEEGEEHWDGLRGLGFEVYEHDELFVLMVMHCSRGAYDEVNFLLLTQDWGQDAYRRVGYFGGPQVQNWEICKFLYPKYETTWNTLR
jgi:hypothetical protein